ncbi:hypothetical protein [Delftia acidovorans]|uniref:hypothetical protein n=1 Tax=Delftia acidovorans TaxID=80866 RepID=UPI00359F1AC1
MKSVSIQTPGRRLVPALVLAAAAVALTGCVVAPAYPVGPSGEVVYAPMAPPPLQTEVIPVAPSPVHVWIGGSWGWGGGRYAWRPGYWAAPPHPGYAWRPHGWDHGPRGWYQRPGGWYRR